MAVKYLSSIDLNGNEIQNVLIHVLGSDPGSPVAGQAWYRSDTGLLSFRNASATIRLGRLDQISAPTGSVSLNSQLITNLASPSDPADAATKGYVDGLVTSGTSWKTAVRAATTVNAALATAYENGDSIDGVALVTGDRILIKDQTAGEENGIYTVNASGAPTRAADADTAGEISQATVFVKEGSANADLAFTLTNDTIVLNTTPLVFVQISGLGQISAGAGLTKTGNTLDVIGTAGRISVTADAVDIDAAYVGQASITTLGTITTGVWTGTDIAVADGGTGRSTLTDRGVLIGRGAAAIDQTVAGTNGQVLVATTGANPAFGNIDLASAAAVGATILAVANGGTGSATAAGARANLTTTSLYATDVGDGAATSIVVTHGLAASKDKIVQVFDNTTPFAQVIVETRHTSNTTLTLVFAVAPTSAQYRVVVIGL